MSRRRARRAAVGNEAPGVKFLDGDLARKHALLILADEVHVRAQRIEAGLHFGKHGAGDSLIIGSP